MKRKEKQTDTRRKDKPESSEKGGLETLSDYFGSYLSALEMVSSRH